MAAIHVESTFQVENNPGCWTGPLTPFERKLLRPLPLYGLEQLRIRFLPALTYNHSPEMGARAVFQMAYETELGAALSRSVTLDPGVKEARVCTRRRYVQIDQSMRDFRFLYRPAVSALVEAEVIPHEHSALLFRYLNKPYAKYRTCAIAALLCFSAALLLPE